MDDARIQRLQKLLSFPCWIENSADLLYLTGMTLSKGRIFVSSREACLYVDGRYYEQAKKQAPCPVSLWEEQKKKKGTRMGFDSATVTYEGYLSLQKTWPETEWIPKPHPLRELRAVKEPKEIEALRKAARLTWEGYRHISGLLKEGIREEELALEFEVFCRKQGASGLSFAPIIAFGPNSAYPHYRAGQARLSSNQVILIDVGAIVEEYRGDMTRIIHFGEIDPRIIHLETIVRRAQKKAIDQVRPGVKIGELDRIVREEFARENVLPYYTHSLGHGIGLEPHEFPKIHAEGEDRETLLKPGMVFTIEPGLYQPGIGGIRLEEMVLVTEKGCETLFPEA